MEEYIIKIWCDEELLHNVYENLTEDLKPKDYDERILLLSQMIKQFENSEVKNLIQKKVQTLGQYVDLLKLINIVTDGEYQIGNEGQWIDMFN